MVKNEIVLLDLKVDGHADALSTFGANNWWKWCNWAGEFVYNIEFNYVHNYGSTISSDYGGIYIGGGGPGGVNNYDNSINCIHN